MLHYKAPVKALAPLIGSSATTPAGPQPSIGKAASRPKVCCWRTVFTGRSHATSGYFGQGGGRSKEGTRRRHVDIVADVCEGEEHGEEGEGHAAPRLLTVVGLPRDEGPKGSAPLRCLHNSEYAVARHLLAYKRVSIQTQTGMSWYYSIGCVKHPGGFQVIKCPARYLFGPLGEGYV